MNNTTLTFLGAAGEVTGSSYLVETSHSKLLIDRGMFQGGAQASEKNRSFEGLDPAQLTAVVLTHGHLDHTGRLPLLFAGGYRGTIAATEATIDMTMLILRDSARLQEADNDRRNRQLQRSGEPLRKPLYTAQEVENLESHFKAYEYDRDFMACPDISVRFFEAGHILGSASLLVKVTDGPTLLFSGDIGPRDMPLLRHPSSIDSLTGLSAVILESTYGDRNHRTLASTVTEFTEILKEAAVRRGKILIPAFAIGRTQQILYHLAELTNAGNIPALPVYLDTPMGAKATHAYLEHYEILDDEAKSMLHSGTLIKQLRAVKVCESAEDSRKLNDLSGPCIIIAGSGMCTGGRILHHLRHSLWNASTTVVIVGYQSEGTLGRKLVDGAKSVSIFNEPVAVNAQIKTLGGFSAHAGRDELLSWVTPYAAHTKKIYLTHGESKQRESLATLIREKLHAEVELPGFLKKVTL